MLAYQEVREAYEAFNKQGLPATASAPLHVEPSSKPLLTPLQTGASHQLPSEVVAHERPQEFGDSSRAVEMPVINSDVIDVSAVSVGAPRRRSEQDSLQQDA